MKKHLTFLILIFLALASCKGPLPAVTEEATVSLPEISAVEYGTDWVLADMEEQIPSDDPDFSVTGSGYGYRDGWLGIEKSGRLDIACVYEPGADERFVFSFDCYTERGGVLWFGFWLYGKSSLPDDGMDGVWIKISDGALEYGDKKYGIASGGPAEIKASVNNGGFEIYADGVLLFKVDQGPYNGGGAVKLYSDMSPVFVKNTAFGLGKQL